MKVVTIFSFVALTINTVHALKLIEVIEEEWDLFKLQFNKTYQDVTEERFRKKIYLDNKLKITKHNKMYETGEETYALEMNNFGDLMQHEYNEMMNGFKRSIKHGLQNYTDEDTITFFKFENVVVPKSIDWRTKGYVTPVKDQGKCGSCWAFSATGALEGQHFRKTKVLVSLSEQNLIDCSRKFGNYGCDGGNTDVTFEYVKDNKGIDTENLYPYEGVDNMCRYNSNNSGSTNHGFVSIPEEDEESLQHVLATVGPVSVTIDASSDKFQFYKEGVYYNPKCNATDLNHCVLVVGYDTNEKEEDYWLVKNSWGKDWGDEGYVKMARNQDNHCGIASQANYPLV